MESVSLKHPSELIDMIVAFTNNRTLRDIRNEVAINELGGMDMNMGCIFDNIANNATAKNTIDNAKFYHIEGVSDNIVIKGISTGLEISLEEAKEIFEKEVLMLETV